MDLDKLFASLEKLKNLDVTGLKPEIIKFLQSELFEPYYNAIVNPIKNQFPHKRIPSSERAVNLITKLIDYFSILRETFYESKEEIPVAKLISLYTDIMNFLNGTISSEPKFSHHWVYESEPDDLILVSNLTNLEYSGKIPNTTFIANLIHSMDTLRSITLIGCEGVPPGFVQLFPKLIKLEKLKFMDTHIHAETMINLLGSSCVKTVSSNCLDLSLLSQVQVKIELDISIPITQEGLVQMLAVPTLTSLRLHDCSCIEDYTVFTPDIHLESLELEESKNLSDLEIKGLLNPNLKTLRINNCSLSDAGIKIISEHSSLENLTLSNVDITDMAMVFLSYKKNLKSLGLTNTRITNLGISMLGQCIQLRRLSITGVIVSASSLEQLCKLPLIKKLTIPQRILEGVSPEYLLKLDEILM